MTLSAGDRLGRYEILAPIGAVGMLRLDPVWDPLRDHPRFQEILEKYGE